MRNHLRWLFLFLFGIALIGCQDDLNINSPINSQENYGLDKLTPAIETLTKDLDLTGSKILISGVGTMTAGSEGTGTINLSVSSGVVIKNVFLYWESRHKSPSALLTTGDPTITVNNVSITGELIGKSNVEGTSKSFVYRKEVTSEGWVVAGVTNSLDVKDFKFTAPDIDRPQGVGLMVVIDDGSNASLEIRDGDDWAFSASNSAYPWLLVTEPQIFTFDPYTFERKVELNLMVADIGVNNGSPRLHRMDITIGDDPAQSFYQPFTNNVGPQFDVYTKELTIPAGYTKVKVQLFSTPDPNISASLVWLLAALTVPTPLSELGDRVWIDNKGGDCNGIQEEGEMGLEGVTVNLYKCSDLTTVFKTTTTNSDGDYLFSNLVPDCYKVQVMLPAGYAFSAQNAGSDDEKDSDVNSSGWTADINLGAGVSDLSNDAGLCPLKSQLGDRVWIDNKGGDCNGIQEEGEMGLEGVTVNLYKCSDLNTVFKTTTTNSDGNYLFTDLDAGCYKVKVMLPTGYTFSTQNAGSDDEKDSDVNSDGWTADVNLGAGVIDLSNDAGLCPKPSKLGDFVWNDLDKDGVQDANEVGIPNVKVDLLDCNGNFIKSTTTNANGYYFFDVEAGSYIVKFYLPDGYAFSPKDQGGDDAKDSDASTTDGKTTCITIGPGVEDLKWDAGMYPKQSSLGDFVWNDLDKDGIQDANEVGIPNVKVDLLDCNGNFLKSTTTDANGYYLFDVEAGSYIVKFYLPDGYAFSPLDQGGDDAKDSDANTTDGKTTCITIGPDVTDLKWDAGMYAKPSKLGDFVWNDLDKDGIQDANEVGIPNVKVDLYDCNGNFIKSTTTNANGYYFFDVEAGSYIVKFNLPDGYAFSPLDQGGDDAKDSDANTTDGKTTCITIGPGVEDLKWDAGMYAKPSKLGDFVWNDLDKDGIQDANELGIPNVKVDLLDCNGNFLKSTTTNANGYYFFDVEAGSYVVKFYLPDGYAFSPKDANGDDAKDSDADLTTGLTTCITIGSGVEDLKWDAGMYAKPSKLGDFVWNDLDKDGVQDANELGIPNVKVDLLDCDGKFIKSTTTNSNGYYFFDVEAGSYIVKFYLPDGYAFSPKDQGGDDAKDSDADLTTGQTTCITIGPGVEDLKWDAGMYELPKPAELGDRVWWDANYNGVQDNGEVGIPNVKVELYTCAGELVDTKMTDALGNYFFKNLMPGDYYVKFYAPAGYAFTKKDMGDNNFDSDADLTTGKTICTTLESAEKDYSWDAGLVKLAELGDRVWKDANINGLQDLGEYGYANVKVELYTCANVLVATQYTNSTGYYLFENLMPGDYYVKFYAPAGWGFTIPNVSSNTKDAIDSDADVTTGKTVCTTLVPGESDKSWDAGLVKLRNCTYTPGYWQTHSKYGPATPFDPVWNWIGEDTPFFMSGKSYYQAINMSSTGGNAYYILAQAYIAAKLNYYAGAYVPADVKAAIEYAEWFFGKYKPTDKLNKPLREKVLMYYELLDKYNNGYIGPGHCDNNSTF